MAVRVALVGGGVFGCVTALELASAGFEVELFERHDDLLMGASRCNQGRLHLGYHYPRSWLTALECKRSAAEFAGRFREAIWAGSTHYYAVAAEGSWTKWGDYLRFCGQLDAGHIAAKAPTVLQPLSVAGCLRVKEAFVDLDRLRELLRMRLFEMNVTVHLGTERHGQHDWVVDATYSRPSGHRRRYEVCEIALMQLPAEFADLSMVIMDGEFVSVDPVPGQSYHMLYDVAHTVHAASEGMAAEVPWELKPMLDRGVVSTQHTHVDAMLDTAARFMPSIRKGYYMGSMFTVRSVPVGVDETDARPTVVTRHGDLVTVQGGKLDTCCAAARKVVAEISTVRTPAVWAVPSFR